MTQRAKRHRLELQREKGRLLNTAGAGADPVAGVFLRDIVVEHYPRVLLLIEMPVKVDVIYHVHQAGPVLALVRPHIVQERQVDHQIGWKWFDGLLVFDCMNTLEL